MKCVQSQICVKKDRTKGKKGYKKFKRQTNYKKTLESLY